MGEFITSDHVSLWDALPKEICEMVYSPGDDISDFGDDEIEGLRIAFAMWVRAIYRAPAEIFLYDQTERKIVDTLLERDARDVFDKNFANSSLIQPPSLVWINRGDYFESLLRNRRPFLYRQKLQIIHAAWLSELILNAPPEHTRTPEKEILSTFILSGERETKKDLFKPHLAAWGKTALDGLWREAAKQNPKIKKSGPKPK